MHRVALSLLIICATACNDNRNIADELPVAVPAASEKIMAAFEEEDSVQEAHEDLDWEKIEVFHFSKALINNKVPLFTRLSRFTTALGEADSLVTPNWEYMCGTQFEEEFTYFYKNGSRFELYKDSLVCSEFMLTPGNTITCDGSVFTHNTTWADIKKRYPNAVHQTENEGSTDIITLRDSDNLDSDSSVRLIFQNGKLVSIVNFIPC